MKKIKGGITAVPGFLASGIHSGIKERKVPDLGVIFSEEPCSAAGLFTTNRVIAAPVRLTQEHIKSGRLQAIVANSGNANACTGFQGKAAAREMAELTARHLGIPPERMAVASTGVIGAPLPMGAVRSGIPKATGRLRPDGSRNAARAIMTTDKVCKETAVRFHLAGRTVTMGGIAKGSGMIHPNMATMLAFLTTDLRIQPSLLHEMLTTAVERSFNMITVDGETSTNDMVLCLANGRADNIDLDQSDSGRNTVQAVLDSLCLELAGMIVRDGEGATKQIKITVKGAGNAYDAKKITLRVANSNLVKTAFFGEDPNWGRIMAAVGSAGVSIKPDRVDISFDRVSLVKDGVGLGRTAEQRAARVLRKRSFTVTIDLHSGQGSATVWTCDLTQDYIRINATYRT